jgi:germination protein M
MRKLSALILILFLSLLLGACHKDQASDDKSVDIYYIDSKTFGLVSESYALIGTKREDQIDELIYMLQKKPDNALLVNALSKSIDVNYSYDDNSRTLFIDFSTAYSEMSVIDEVLCRAAIIKTLQQISDIDYLQFSIDGQQLQDSDGVIGSLTAEDFVDSTEANTVIRTKLYFANKEGDALVEYLTEIDYTGTESIEDLVIQQLINGPTEIGMYSTIPEGTVLLNSSKSDGICTVDFNENYLDKLPGIRVDVAIYSVVNTLIELPGSDIKKVQFTINGKAIKTFNETKDFDSIFDQNLGLIESPD